MKSTRFDGCSNPRRRAWRLPGSPTPRFKRLKSKTLQYLEQPRSIAWSAAILELDQEFHELISSNCGNVRLHEEIERYRNLVQTIRQAVGNTAQAQEAALREHLAVIDALLSGDPESAGAAMTNHIRRGTEAAVTILFGSAPAPAVSVTTAPAVYEPRSDIASKP